MGADKNSSPKRELGLYPKFTTKDPHMSLPRSRSHNGPTNLGTNPKQSQSESETRKSKGLSNLAQCQAGGPAGQGPTVRGHWTDGP
jgi:hypothetical protein